MGLLGGAPFPLFKDEELILVTRPHVLAMTDLMLFWLFIAGLGLLHIMYHPEALAFADRLFKYDFPYQDRLVDRAYELVWGASLVIPLFLMALLRINFGYVLTMLGVLAVNFLVKWKLEPGLSLPAEVRLHLSSYLLIAVGLVGVVGVEVFRRGHRYYLTTHRIVSRFGSLKVSERSLLYSKIDDLILQQGLVGAVFNFGTLIPITSSGLGMGQDMAVAGLGVGAGKRLGASLLAAGGKMKNVPRELSIYVLYRVPWPEEARDVILELMQERERAR